MSHSNNQERVSIFTVKINTKLNDVKNRSRLCLIKGGVINY